jgi:pimeloyl-ACP methyl ester carboxylesterase
VAIRVHVVGSSPRTGTTLLTELLVMGFEVDGFAEHERSIFREPHVPCEIYVSKDPKDVHVAARVLALDPQLWILHMVRDPRDVVVSVHARDPDAYWTHLRLWKSYRRSARRAEGHPRFLTIRYEDLVRDPDAIQDLIASRLPFLKRRRRFSEFHRFADPPARSLEALSGVREIATDRIGRWRAHKPRLAAQLARHGPIDRDLELLGYERDGGWRRELADVTPDGGRTHLREAVSMWERAAVALRRRRALRRYRRRLRQRAAGAPPADPGPFALERVAAGPVELEVGTLGSGPAVLLLPGEGGAGTEQYAELGRALAAAGLRAVAVNPRGVSRSRGPLADLTLHDLARDVFAVAARCGTPVHVVGRGFGNRVARCFASDFPHAVRSVTLVAAGGRIPAQRSLHPPASRRRRKRWRSAGSAQRRASGATPLAHWWSGGSAPMLVIQGLADDVAPPENGRLLARDHPDRVRLLEVAEAGHEVLAERPDLVVPAIVAFVREIGCDTGPRRGAEGGAPEGAELTSGARS